MPQNFPKRPLHKPEPTSTLSQGDPPTHWQVALRGGVYKDDDDTCMIQPGAACQSSVSCQTLLGDTSSGKKGTQGSFDSVPRGNK